MDLALFSHEMPSRSVGELADLFAAHGVRHVQLHGLLRDEALRDPVAFRTELDVAGIACIGIGAYVNPIAPDPDQRRAAIDLVSRSLEAAATLGVPAVATETGTLHPTGEWDDDPRNVTPEAWDFLHEALDELLPIAERHGAVLALEGYVKNVVRSLEDFARLVERYPTPALGLVADPYNYTLAPEDNVAQDLFDRFQSRLVVAHLKDWTRDGGLPPFGDGTFDQTPYLSLLRDRRPDLVPVVEHLDATRLDEVLGRVRQAFSQL